MSLSPQPLMDNKYFNCNICDARYKHRRSLNAHVKMNHKTSFHNDTLYNSKGEINALDDISTSNNKLFTESEHLNDSSSEGEEAMVDENSEYDADEDEKSNNSSSDEEVENDEGKETTISKFRKMFGVKRKKKHHMNKFSKHQKLIENICDVPSINETDNSFWLLLMNFWDNEWSLQEKYGNFVRLSKLSEKDEIFRFINNYTCHLRKLCSFDVAFRVAMNQASSFLKDIEDKIANGEDNVDEDMVENEEDSSEDEDDKENILFWKIDLSFWKLLLSDMSTLDNKTDERILSFIATDYQMKSNALHIKIMREHSNLMNHFEIVNTDDTLELFLRKYKDTFDKYETEFDDANEDDSSVIS